jgi:hypothetical protein
LGLEAGARYIDDISCPYGKVEAVES